MRLDRYRGGPGGGLDAEGSARALGWFSVGLGLAEIIAARGLSRSLGMGRVAGDALDLAALGTAALRPGNPKQGRAAVALATIAGITALDAFCARRLDESTPASPAQGPEVEGAITIGKPANEFYQRLRDPQTLAQVMVDVATVRPSSSDDGRMHWRAEGLLGRAYEWDTEVVYDRPGEGVS